MPYYMDRHDLEGASAADVAAAHMRDVAVQDQFGVQYIHYWFDYDRQHAFCLAKGPDAATVNEVHRISHGLVANRIIEVDEASVTRFMGEVMPHPMGEAYEETAFRAILFTDLADSTKLTQRVGDAAMMVIVRRHDDIVREALERTGGTLVKHTGDGIMASFVTATSAIDAAIRIQQGLKQAESAGEMPLGVRIGIAAGEPVSDGNDLFGSAVQLAARLSTRALPRSIVVSAMVRELASGDGYRFGPWRALRLKGFDETVRTSQVLWTTTLA